MPITLPDIGTDPGVLARMLIAENRNPGSSSYDEDLAKISFRAMKATVTNRLANNPGQFGAPGATTWADIICAPGQVHGFSRDGHGKVLISDDVQENIDDVMTKANTGAPGAYATFVANILAAVNATVNDPFAGVTSINGTVVTGGTYAWRTAGSADPGGRFFAIPAALDGVISGNQFYTLTVDS